MKKEINESGVVVLLISILIVLLTNTIIMLCFFGYFKTHTKSEEVAQRILNGDFFIFEQLGPSCQEKEIRTSLIS